MTVENGIDIFIGTVDSIQEFHAAIDLAFEGGARSVQSTLEVKGIEGVLAAYHSEFRLSCFFGGHLNANKPCHPTHSILRKRG